MRKLKLTVILTVFSVLLSCVTMDRMLAGLAEPKHEALIQLVKQHGTHMGETESVYEFYELNVTETLPKTSTRMSAAISIQLHYGNLKEDFVSDMGVPSGWYLQMIHSITLLDGSNNPTRQIISSMTDFSPIDGKVDEAFSTAPWGGMVGVEPSIGTDFMYGEYYDQVIDMVNRGLVKGFTRPQVDTNNMVNLTNQ